MLEKDKKQMLEKEIPILSREVEEIYLKLDKQLNLHGAALPVEFGYDDKSLGHYMPKTSDTEEHFAFSLLFIGYCLSNQISKEERENLYKHEYAHYMTHHLTIPNEYLWQPGAHGSAWKYCCALIGVVPSRYFSGEENLEVDYKSHLKKPPVNHQTVRLLDNAHQNAAYHATKNKQIQYETGDIIEHPKFGTGVIEAIEQTSGSVRLTIRFEDKVREIDQKWLVKTKYHRAGNSKC